MTRRIVTPPSRMASVLLAVGAFAVATGACSQAEPTSATPGGPATAGGGPALEDRAAAGPATVRYELDWALGERAVVADDGTLTVHTDLGYVVTIESGWLVTSAVQLVACDGEELQAADAAPEPSWGGALADAGVSALRAVLGIGTAHAGHGDVTNPIAASVPTAEPIDADGVTALGERDVTGLRYCQAHYLAARGFDASTYEDVPTMEGLSLEMAVRWTAPDGTETEAALRTHAAYGVVHALYPTGRFGDEAERFELDTDTYGATVRVTRQLSEMFDGLDLQALRDRDEEGDLQWGELAHAVLGQLAESAHLTVDAHGILD